MSCCKGCFYGAYWAQQARLKASRNCAWRPLRQAFVAQSRSAKPVSGGRSTSPHLSDWPRSKKKQAGGVALSVQSKARRIRANTSSVIGAQTPELYNYKATLTYKGTAYKGWQVQNGKSRAPTVQGKVEEAISAVKHEDRRILRIQGAGRTDAGVHALGQVFNFYSTKSNPPEDRLLAGMNAHLPPDIRVTALQRVPLDFSARYSALSKSYTFRLQTGRIRDPFELGLSQHVFKPLDLAAMRVAADSFVGTHDFTQFSSVPAVTRPLSPVKTLSRLDITVESGGLRVGIRGSGFLYNQCRHMVGALIEVGLGKLQPADVARLLQVGSGQQPGLTYRGWTLAAAEGLYLTEVEYPPHTDPTRLMYPDLPHDRQGRVFLEHLPPPARRELSASMKQDAPA